MKIVKKHYYNNKIHFIGAGGVSMSALAKHAIKNGALVSASDLCKCEHMHALQDMGAQTYVGHKAENVGDANCVVYTQAIKNDNPEFIYAKNKGIELLRRSQFLSKIMNEYDKRIAVSGSHGKTTTTAMIASVLLQAKLNPTVFLGGEDLIFGNYIDGDKKIVIAEACEYKKSFLDLVSDISVVLNIDNDHMDCYKDLNEMVQSFKQFIGQSVAILNADDQNCLNISNYSTITFGIENRATIKAKDILVCDSRFSFTVYESGIKLGRIKLAVFGKHNIYNALASIAVCRYLKIPFANIKIGLEKFKGVKRRNEYIGEYFGAKCFCDYAHHPKEIIETLKAYDMAGKDYITVFQPHTYSRTKLLMLDFVLALKQQQPLIIMETYSAREDYDEEGSALALKHAIEEGGNNSVIYAQENACLGCIIQTKMTKETKRIIFLGAGDIYQKAKNILVQKKQTKI